ncbi:MAG: DUF1549 domain-containing protein [Planctomycetota bacterium]|nr:MAG: DUF1549 domain-containing protein [Planctomycetota bacterium]
MIARPRVSTGKAIVPLLAATVLLLGAAVGAPAQEIASLAVYPPDRIRLETAADRQSFVVVATRTDGVTIDVTDAADVVLADASKARREGNTLYPLADGDTELRISYGGKSLAVPVQVVEAKQDRPLSFRLDVMPVFMRAGCNTGGCHGAASGKDGFRLSLFGFDPEGDYFRLTREVPFRRVNLAVPEESLLLQKAIGAVQHTGGKRFEPESEYYQTLLRWLREGAPADAGDVASIVRIEVFPKQIVLEGEGASQRMVVRAHYSDGTDRDVTNLTLFVSNNDYAVPVDPAGIVSAANRGEAFILARFDTKSVGSQVLVLPKDASLETTAEKPVNYIDELVGDKLRKLRIRPSALCSDEEFLRRVTLDVVGLLPTEEEYAEFMADTSPDKRAKLVDRLLARKEFAELWAMKWAEVLMVRSNNRVSYKSTYLYSQWLTEKIASGEPFDEVVREILAADGGTFTNPATNFYQVETDTLKTAENVAQVFLGRRIQCAQCHNHPFDRWTMDDYYSFAAFFSQIGRKTGEDYRETIVFNRGSGEIRHPVGNRVMAPKFLGGDAPDTRGKDRRKVLAEWITSNECPDFSRNVANRVWAHFFGKGIVDPVDDVRISNPPSNPELYDALARKLVDYKYDVKKLVRDICLSNTYQRSCVPNETNADDERNFSRALVRRVQAEIMLDCVCQVTESPEKFRGLPLGARAVQIADGTTSNYFLTTFGRSPRDTVCACDVRTDPTLSQALHLLNGTTVENKIRNGKVIDRWTAEGLSPEQIIERLYVRCLTRKPTAEEREKLAALLADAENPVPVLQDVFWAILNSREFMFNH